MRTPMFNSKKTDGQSNAPYVMGFDMDGVIVDNTQNKIRLAKQFGFDLKPADAVAERFQRLIPETILAKMRPILYDSEDMGLKPDIIPGAREGLEMVRQSGRPYFLISRRGNWMMAVKMLEHQGLWPKYFNRDNAFFVITPEDKDIKAKSLGISAYVDDQPSVLEKLASVPQRLLFDQFRQFGDLSFPHKKVSSWEELMGFLEIS